ncbi:CDK2-associated and cullin domain-containing protein 1 [Silurus asotus]|uniref:CDK2-associated and cullin domain-containing protein 1 n=1 Tax=Silurus asotus TaxID=30991 RepID=A0AAD5FC06_SILAS|nr:CDK2-associated and cullin domain-containing protein 1 [Silurus asotus]
MIGGQYRRKSMNAMTADVYKKTYWPRLEKAVEQLLTQSPMEYTSISYEQIYSLVYKCVCQQYSEHLYSDLILKITSYLQQVCIKLQVRVVCIYLDILAAGYFGRYLLINLNFLLLFSKDSRPESFVENFNLAFTQYMAAIQCIIPVFIYMNKFYVESKLNKNLKDDLMDLFSAHVAEKHISILISRLKKADAMPFQVNPSTMASVVKGLYALQPDWAKLAPELFSRFIPQIHPPVLESDLLCYAAEDQKLQMELSLNGFPR